MFQSSSTQNDFNSTEAELKISYLKPSDIKGLQTEEIKQAQIHIALLGWMLSCLENTWVWRRSKTKNHVGIDRQLFKETDFMHMWSCNMSSKRSHSKLHLFAFWSPGHFGTQTSYHSYCTATLWTFSRGKFYKGGWALPRQSLHVFLDCTAAKTINETEQNPNPLSPKHMPCTEELWTCTHGWEHRAKWFSVPLCTEEFGALHYLKLHQSTASLASDIRWGKPRNRCSY